MSTQVKEIKQYEMISIDPADVVKVYSASKEGCRCGCMGKYFYNPEHQEHGGKERGYEVSDNEVNMNMVKKVCKILNDNAASVEVQDGYIFNYQMENGHVYTAYAVESAKDLFVTKGDYNVR